MVVTRLSGGLGNQIFQYAAGRALALARNVPLALDASLLESVSTGVTPRAFALDEFELSPRFASANEIATIVSRNGFWGSRPARAIRKLAPPRFRSEYYEQSQAFDENLLRLGGDVYIAGHWQSEKYFGHAAAQIRDDLVLRNPLSPAAELLAGEIAASTHPVSIHVRRGDYASNPSATKHHGLLGLDYYREAIGEITSIAPKASFFVFSDDVTWVRENVKLDAPLRAVDAEGRTDAEDLVLISKCLDHVISNSSFSWWGAWLSSHASKKVVAPAHWFADPDTDSSDIVPEDWTRV